jgi:hypothetical protein
MSIAIDPNAIQPGLGVSKRRLHGLWVERVRAGLCVRCGLDLDYQIDGVLQPICWDCARYIWVGSRILKGGA